MIRNVLVDTGPLVALLDRRDRYHGWATRQLAGRRPPLLTCEAVLAEASHLLRNVHGGGPTLLELVRRRVLTAPFRLDEEVARVAKLMSRYADVPMSLADACLVRLAEQNEQSAVMTLDGDFRIYRKNGRQVIPTVMPDHV
jgi:predicted nucleic acid-binding protein